MHLNWEACSCEEKDILILLPRINLLDRFGIKEAELLLWQLWKIQMFDTLSLMLYVGQIWPTEEGDFSFKTPVFSRSLLSNRSSHDAAFSY